jgi:predicted phage terminase large subunit-like protein
MNESIRYNRQEYRKFEEMLGGLTSKRDRFEVEGILRRLDDDYEAIDKWEIVEYPALATSDEYLHLITGDIVRVSEQEDAPDLATHQLLRKKDEALHDARFSRQLLLKYKLTMNPRHWAALYQQNPVPDEGLFFTKDLFKYRAHVPEIAELNCFATWDLAIGTKTHNDYTVGVVGGIDYDDNLWILDVLRGRWGDLYRVANTIIDTHVKYRCLLTGIEKGQLELALKPVLSRAMRDQRQYIPLAEGESALKPITDKSVRARPLLGRMQQGKVIFPENAPWVQTVVTEMLHFPAGTHDDCVDALSWLVRMTNNQTPPKKETVKNESRESWRTRIPSLTGGGEAKSFMAR